MAISKEKKERILKEVSDALQNAASVVFVNFHGLPVADATQLRHTLREHGVRYKVAKKTLVKRALDTVSIQGEQPSLDGELAIAYGEDLLAPAREIYAFQKDHKDELRILGGVFEGKYMSREEMEDIASIPPLEVLRGQFVNLINTPIRQLVVSLDQIAEKKETVAS